MSSEEKQHSETKYWLDHPRNVSRIVYTLYAVCTLLVLVDLLSAKDGHFGFERWPLASSLASL